MTSTLGRVLFVALAAPLAFASCGRDAPPAGRQSVSAPPPSGPAQKDPAAQKQVAAEQGGAAPDKEIEPGAGRLPFDFPAVSTSARGGDFVLAPSKGWLSEALEKGAERQPFIFYGAWMLKPGPHASRLKTLPGQLATLPNAMIIPVGRGETAKPGDIVLTAWASGSGMQRAIVVEGGTPEAPRVRYLDLELDNPSGWGKKVDTLKPNTFHVLTKPGEPGTSVACRDGERNKRWVVVREHGGKILGLGFAGKMQVLQRDACKDLPIVPEVKAGDTVHVPVIGAFTEAKVTRVDKAVGRVWVKHDFGGVDGEQAFGFTNVAPSL